MPRLRPGRDQLNIINVSDEVIREFESERKGKGPGNKDVPRWELFEKMWTYCKARGVVGQNSQGVQVAPKQSLLRVTGPEELANEEQVKRVAKGGHSQPSDRLHSK